MPRARYRGNRDWRRRWKRNRGIAGFLIERNISNNKQTHRQRPDILMRRAVFELLPHRPASLDLTRPLHELHTLHDIEYAVRR